MDKNIVNELYSFCPDFQFTPAQLKKIKSEIYKRKENTIQQPSTACLPSTACPPQTIPQPSFIEIRLGVQSELIFKLFFFKMFIFKMII